MENPSLFRLAQANLALLPAGCVPAFNIASATTTAPPARSPPLPLRPDMKYLIRKVFAETTQFVVVHKHRGQTFDPSAVTYHHRISRATVFKDRRDAER